MKSYHPYAMVTIFCWAISYPLTRMALRHFTPLSLGFLRYFFASICMVALVLIMKLGLPRRADLKWFALSGTAGFCVYVITFNYGSVTVPSAMSSVIISMAPVITALLARVVYGERLSVVKWLAIGVEFAGVGLLALADGRITFNAGVLWLLASSFSFSVYNLLQRRLTRTYTSMQVTAYSIFMGALMLALTASGGAAAELFSAPPRQYLILAGLALLSSAIAYASWTKAISKALNTANVSNYMFITPFLASIMAYILAGETIDAGKAAGGAIVLCGVFLFNFGDRLLPASREVSSS